MELTECVVKFKPIESPLAAPSHEPIALAARPASLKGRVIALVDNGKLTLGNTRILTDLLKKRLEEEGIKQLVDVRAHMDPADHPDLNGFLQDTLRQMSIDGVDLAILGLGDSGAYSVRLTLLALELEKKGLPTAIICTKSLAPTVAMIATSSCPNLPIITVMHPTWSASEEEVIRTTLEAVPNVIYALTHSEGEIAERMAAKMFTGMRGLPLYPAEKTYQGGVEGSGQLSVEIDPGDFIYDLYERFCESRLCDGFPIIPPTAERVSAMLRYTDREPDHVIADKVIPAMAPITVRKLAVNAVMAGCKPEYFPIVVTAFEAMAEPEYSLGEGNTTFGMVGPSVIVSGPIAEEIGMNSRKGLLSPGCRANSTIGRAIFLALNNICGSIPGLTDNSGIGSPVKYSYCFAEQREANPWKSQNEEFFDEHSTVVTVLRMQDPHSVMDHASETAEDFMTTLAEVARWPEKPVNQPVGNFPRAVVIILSPDHIRLLTRDGWTKKDIKLFLFEHCRTKVQEDKHISLAKRGYRPRLPKWMYSTYDGRIPVFSSPEDILIVVGGEVGPHSAVCTAWDPCKPVTKAVTLKDGTRVQSVRQFLR